MDALLDLELRTLHGERMPAARSRSGQRAALWAAALVVGLTVLYGVYRLGGADAGGGGRGRGHSGTVAVDPTQDPDPSPPRPARSVFGPDGAPRPFASEAEATTPEELAALPADTKSLKLTWDGAEGLDGLTRLTRLETLRVECARVPRSVVPVARLVEFLRALPQLERLYLDALQDVEPGDLEPLTVMPALRYVSLRGACWKGTLAALCRSASLEALDLTALTLTEDDWQALQGATGLRHLGLWSVETRGAESITSQDVRDLLAGLPELVSVRLASTWVDGDLIAALAAAENVRALELLTPSNYGADLVTPVPVDVSPIFAIDRWTGLSLRFGGTLSPQDLAGIGRMKRLVSFELGNGATLPDRLDIPAKIGEALAPLPDLRQLDFMRGTVDVRWIEPLAGRPLTSIRMLASLDRRENLAGARAQLAEWFPTAEIDVLPFPRQTMEVVPGVRLK